MKKIITKLQNNLLFLTHGLGLPLDDTRKEKLDVIYSVQWRSVSKAVCLIAYAQE